MKLKKETEKILRKMRREGMKDPEKKIEYKLQELNKPVTLQEIAKKVRFSQSKTLKLMNNLFKAGILQVSLTPYKKLLKGNKK